MTRHRGVALALLTVPALAACAPVPLDRAERQCLRDAELASRPRGEIAIGTGTGGPQGRFEVDISSDFLLQRDPSAVYARCVQNLSGLPPSQPLYTRTDWKG
ncbi:hypothetical protein [Szabonella alba]|uniref:Lipoprotein n=1 Tax=Szabonella alba TaxID=2804194 RepID=A0A8K0V8J1_9RHOB|nr:hypothetical protein [Szabonella alba]MBL4915658.1 hypothetical protein [Szabonella alba]